MSLKRLKPSSQGIVERSFIEDVDLIVSFYYRKSGIIKSKTYSIKLNNNNQIPLDLIQLVSKFAKYVVMFDIYDPGYIEMIHNRHNTIIKNKVLINDGPYFSRIITKKTIKKNNNVKIKIITGLDHTSLDEDIYKNNVSFSFGIIPSAFLNNDLGSDECLKSFCLIYFFGKSTDTIDPDSKTKTSQVIVWNLLKVTNYHDIIFSNGDIIEMKINNKSEIIWQHNNIMIERIKLDLIKNSFHFYISLKFNDIDFEFAII